MQELHFVHEFHFKSEALAYGVERQNNLESKIPILKRKLISTLYFWYPHFIFCFLAKKIHTFSTIKSKKKIVIIKKESVQINSFLSKSQSFFSSCPSFQGQFHDRVFSKPPYPSTNSKILEIEISQKQSVSEIRRHGPLFISIRKPELLRLVNRVKPPSPSFFLLPSLSPLRNVLKKTPQFSHLLSPLQSPLFSF